MALPPLLQAVLYGWNPHGVAQRCTLIISSVMYRKVESVEYSGLAHRSPGHQTQQLSSISAATEPTLSSYYVWYITMRWCDLTWQPVCWLSHLAEIYETLTLTKWGPSEGLECVWPLWSHKTLKMKRLQSKCSPSLDRRFGFYCGVWTISSVFYVLNSL